MARTLSEREVIRFDKIMDQKHKGLLTQEEFEYLMYVEWVRVFQPHFALAPLA